eukprot:1211271-Amphidinium_carterae.1
MSNPSALAVIDDELVCTLCPELFRPVVTIKITYRQPKPHKQMGMQNHVAKLHIFWKAMEPKKNCRPVVVEAVQVHAQGQLQY